MHPLPLCQTLQRVINTPTGPPLCPDHVFFTSFGCRAILANGVRDVLSPLLRSQPRVLGDDAWKITSLQHWIPSLDKESGRVAWGAHDTVMVCASSLGSFRNFCTRFERIVLLARNNMHQCDCTHTIGVFHEPVPSVCVFVPSEFPVPIRIAVFERHEICALRCNNGAILGSCESWQTSCNSKGCVCD